MKVGVVGAAGRDCFRHATQRDEETLGRLTRRIRCSSGMCRVGDSGV